MRLRTIIRLGWRLAILIAAFGSLATMAVSVSIAADDTESAVAGRLGGSLASFVDRFGEPASHVTALGDVYAVDGYGLVAVYVEGRGNEEIPEPASRLNRIVVSSPRPLDSPTTEPHAADWSVAEAVTRVVALLPTDVELSAFERSTDGRQIAMCQSAALDDVFEIDSTRQCRVVFIMPAADTVAYALLSVTFDDTGAMEALPAIAPCAGVVDWIRAAGERLDAAEALITQVNAIAATDPTAAATLREVAAGLHALAADQRASEPPGAAEQANDYLISALTTYATAIETAADGVAADDPAVIEQAITTFDEAGGLVAQATTELEAAGAACALQLGTPVPVAHGSDA